MASDIPYDTQFEIMSNLPYDDLSNYYKTSSTAYKIYHTKAFWRYKTYKDFGVNIDNNFGFWEIDGYNNRYTTIKYLYETEPENLFNYSIDSNDLKAVPRLLPVLHYYSQQRAVESSLIKALNNNLPVLLEQLMVVYHQFFGPVRLSTMLVDVFEEAVIRNRLDYIKIIGHYFRPSQDEMEELIESILVNRDLINSATIQLLNTMDIKI